jgi:hypothetical protein
MQTELPTGSIAAIATIIAALIAAAISFVNLTLNKEQKTSEFRQAWIDALREDLAVFFAATRAFIRASQEVVEAKDASQPLAMTKEKISELRYQVAETQYRIRLRLNLKECEHEELLRLMKAAIDKQQGFLTGAGTPEDALQAVEIAADYAPQILKAEWERVKKGELPFQLARNWVAPGVFSAALLVVALLWAGKLTI